MNRTILIAIVALLAVIAGVMIFRAAEEHDRSNLDISVGKDGVKVD